MRPLRNVRKGRLIISSVYNSCSNSRNLTIEKGCQYQLWLLGSRRELLPQTQIFNHKGFPGCSRRLQREAKILVVVVRGRSLCKRQTYLKVVPKAITQNAQNHTHCVPIDSVTSTRTLAPLRIYSCAEHRLWSVRPVEKASGRCARQGRRFREV